MQKCNAFLGARQTKMNKIEINKYLSIQLVKCTFGIIILHAKNKNDKIMLFQAKIKNFVGHFFSPPTQFRKKVFF